ncbi:GNAT family N-acetyltransferase [Lysinibacillus telephonicus]|uniref:GNAT family N-acetyltransferase n=2 Tax=Bacillaceae TaxID=186817 RepID=UPI003BA11302
MRLTEELIQYYLPYFKRREDLEKALFFEVSTFDQKKTFKFIKSAVERHSKLSIQYTQEATGVIYTDLYEIYFAVIPTGDLVYYTINKKTNRKGNYHRLMKLESIYNHLIKLGVLEESIQFEVILHDAIFREGMIELFSIKQQSNIESKLDEDDWSYISINSSLTVNKEFFVIDGSGEIVLNTEEEMIDVGYFDFRIFNSNLMNKNQLWDAADAASGDEEWLMSIFLELFEEEIEECSPKFLMLNTISIKPTYRNKGYGKTAVKELIQQCGILEIDYIVLKPSPIEDVDFSDEHKMKRKKDIEKIVSFYDQLGFNTYFLCISQVKFEPFIN